MHIFGADGKRIEVKPTFDLDLSTLPESTQSAIQRIRERLPSLEQAVKDEAGLYGGERFWSYSERFRTGNFDLEDLANEQLSEIVATAPDTETLNAGLAIINTYLDFYDGTKELLIPDRESSPDGHYERELQISKRRIGSGVSLMLETLPETLTLATEWQMGDILRGLFTGVDQMLYWGAKDGNFDNVHCCLRYYVVAKRGEEWTHLPEFKQMHDLGFARYIPAFLAAINHTGAIEPLHLSSAVKDFLSGMERTKGEVPVEYVDAMMPLLSKVVHHGSIPYSIVAGLFWGYGKDHEKEWPEFKDLPEEEKQRINDIIFRDVNVVLEPIADHCPILLYYHSGKDDLFKQYRRFKEAGIEDRFLDVLRFAVEAHSQDPIPEPSQISHEHPSGLVFFRRFTKMYSVLGEESFDIYKIIRGRFDDDLTARVLESLHLAVKESKDNLMPWLDYVADEARELDEKVERGEEKRRIHRYYRLGEVIRSSALALSAGMDIDQYKEYLPLVEKYDLEGRFDHVAEVLLSEDLSLRTKDRKLREYSLLVNLEGMPDPTVDNSWPGKAAELMGLELDRYKELMQMVKGLTSKRAVKKTIQKNPYLAEIRVKGYLQRLNLFKKLELDPLKVLQVYSALDAAELTSSEHLARVATVINSDEPLERKIEFFSKFDKRAKKYLNVQEPSNTDFVAWYEGAQRAVSTFFQSVPNAPGLRYSENFALDLICCTKGEDARDLLQQIVELEVQGKHNKALFPVGKVYETIPIGTLKALVDYTEATKYLTYGLLSRREDRLAEAGQIFNPQMLSSARQLLLHSHVPPGAFYAQISKNLEILQIPDCPREERMAAANSILSAIEMNYLVSSKPLPGRTELRSMFKQLVELKEAKSDPFNCLTTKMQDWTLHDLGDGRRLHCCALMSEDKEAEEVHSLFYHADPHIGIIHHSPGFNSSIYQPIGASILVNCENRHDQLVLGVDSFEGGVDLDRMEDLKWLGAAARGIAGSAIDTKSEYVFINSGRNGMNGKSRKFAGFMGEVLGFGSPVSVDLAKIRGDGHLRIPKETRYLEMWRHDQRKELAGETTGFYLPTDMFVEIANALPQ